MKSSITILSVLSFLIFSDFTFAKETLPLPFMNASDFTPFWRDEKSNQNRIPATVSAFQFKNQLNKALTESHMRGHISLVNFFFTSCGNVCPRLMNRVQSIQKDLSSLSGLKIYSISVMPEVDSPTRLADYAQARQLNLKNWDLITGDRSAIYDLGRGVFRADRNPDGTIANSEFIHTQAIYLIDSDLRIRGIYQSDKLADMKLLVEDAFKLVRADSTN
jgi:protein SCO1/2